MDIEIKITKTIIILLEGSAASRLKYIYLHITKYKFSKNMFLFTNPQLLNLYTIIYQVSIINLLLIQIHNVKINIFVP
jgi:hypothetical protein